MKHLFASYEIAKRAKELGFNDDCFACYHDEGKRVNYTSCPVGNTNSFWKSYQKEEIVTAPLKTQVIQWLAREHDMFVVSHFRQGIISWKCYRRLKEQDTSYHSKWMHNEHSLCQAAIVNALDWIGAIKVLKELKQESNKSII